MVRRLAERGAKVLGIDRDEAQLRETATAPSDAVRAAVVDVTDSRAVAAAMNSAAEPSGQLDILVNAAGIQRYGTVETTDEATWDQVLDVNLKGAFLTAKHVVPYMRRAWRVDRERV